MNAASLCAVPLFDPLRIWLEQLPAVPDAQAVAELAERYPILTDSGQRVRFVPPRADGQVYECRIWDSGEVETRPDNWHDFFNALVWLSFPQTKIAVSAAHMRAMQAPMAQALGPIFGFAFKVPFSLVNRGLHVIALCMMRCKNILIKACTPWRLKSSNTPET